jgi:hypothetical protein
MDDRRRPDDLPVVAGALQADAGAVGPRPDPGHVPAHAHGRASAVVVLCDLVHRGLRARPVEAAAVGRERGGGGLRVVGERRGAAIVAARPRRHEGIERLPRAGRLGAAHEDDDRRGGGDERQGAEGEDARNHGIGPGHHGREASPPCRCPAIPPIPGSIRTGAAYNGPQEWRR